MMPLVNTATGITCPKHVGYPVIAVATGIPVRKIIGRVIKRPVFKHLLINHSSREPNPNVVVLRRIPCYLIA